MDIHNVCSQNNICIQSNWVPRNQNKYADELSRYTDHDDWSINDETFAYLDDIWGPFSIDRFATHYNSHCIRFNSVIWCPGTEAIDSFRQFWGNDNNWLVPPPSLIAKTINKMRNDHAKGVLIVPEWKSSAFWPLICTRGVFKEFILDAKYLSNDRIIVRGAGRNGVFGKWPLNFKMLALKIAY